MKKILSILLIMVLTLSVSSAAFAAGGTWKQDNKGWWYVEEDGSYPKNTWKLIDEDWYYFDAAGYAYNGWLFDGQNWYLLGESGAMATGWQLVDEEWYYMDENGAMQTGWLLDGDTWYFLYTNGAMATEWLVLGDYWYYFDASGAMLTGEQTINGEKIDLGETGALIGVVAAQKMEQQFKADASIRWYSGTITTTKEFENSISR